MILSLDLFMAFIITDSNSQPYPQQIFAVPSDHVSALADFEKTALIFYHSFQGLSIHVTRRFFLTVTQKRQLPCQSQVFFIITEPIHSPTCSHASAQDSKQSYIFLHETFSSTSVVSLVSARIEVR